jgi:hypothetical protein
LPDKVVELISKGVEEALGVEPEYALRLMEEEERKKGMKISEKVRRKVYAEVAKKYERAGRSIRKSLENKNWAVVKKYRSTFIIS